jgi:PAS domain S-box-containing protein
MIAVLRRFLFGSIRRQLIIGIALVHAVMMTLFVYDLVYRQRDFLHQQTQERAVSLARATAASGTQWVLSNDLIGMEELLSGLATYPDLRYAMILAPDGRVLAHSDARSVGRYLADPVSLQLFAGVAEARTLVNSGDMVDVAYPILQGRTAIGWTRVALGQDRQAASLSAVTREGLVYTLAAILIGTLFAILMARGMTRGLYVLRGVAEAVGAGRRDLRAKLRRDDEIGQLAEGFDRMLEQLADNERRLRDSGNELRASRRLLDSVIENIPNMLFLKRAEDLRFVLLNKAAEDLLGLPRAAMLGKNDQDLFPPAQADFFTAKDREVLAAQDILDIAEETIDSRHLGQRVLHTKKLALLDEAGRPEYLLGISEDITEVKRARDELARHRDHLETLVAERTADLAQARDQAEAANRAKSVFLSNMSHELRTPLNAILGFAQLMERDAQLSPEQRRNLATIHRSGHHLLDLINDVLDISRIEAGRTTIQTAPFDLDDTLRAIEEMTRVRADAKGLSFFVERAAVTPRYVSGDAPRLRQILLNLLSNAVKYTDRGGVRLRIAPVGGGQLRFEVIDTGPGISSADQRRIFEAFYQTTSGAAKGEGAGLGLAISREYARLMGGELGVRSAAGEGSTFFCDLPLPEVEESLVDASLPHRVSRLKPGQPDIDVLVVEDNADNRELLAHLLQRVGFQVRDAANGEQAIASFLTRRPDFIWMDMRMPVLDGYQATRQIRALPGGGEVKIAALTASAFMENREEILAAGCDEMLAKPLDEQQIFETMARLLGVAYDYERRDAEGAAPGVAAATSLRGLPIELAAELRAAAESLDMEASRQVIERVAAVDAAAAHTLNALVDDFRFEEILRQLPPGGLDGQSTT